MFIQMIKLLFLTLFISNAKAAELQIVTSDFSPYQKEVDGKVEGITTDIVRDVVAKAGYNGNIRMYPWPRAYKMAQREPNVIIYSIIRTPEREKLFKWIGVIAPFEVYFWKLESRKDITLKNVEDAKRFVSGGVFDDVKASYLQSIGFKAGTNLEFTGNDTLNIRKLFAGRIDLLPYDELSLPYKIIDTGLDFKKVKKLVKIEGISHDLYMASSLKTSDEIVVKLSRALENFKKTKKYKEIKSRIK